MTETQSEFQSDIDLDLEKAGLLAYYSEFLVASRPAHPMLIFWRGKERVMAITCRNWEDEHDKHKAIMEMLFMSPAVNSTTMVLSLVDPVKLINGIKRSVIIVTVTCHGALATVHPYLVNDEDNTIEWEEDPEIDPNGGGAYNEIIKHMLPIFARQRRAIFSATDMVEYLSSQGFEIQFFGDHNMSTIATMTI